MLSPVGDPAPLSIRQPKGVPLELILVFRDQLNVAVDMTDAAPQLCLLARSSDAVAKYDVDVFDTTNGRGIVEIPGSDIMDPRGYTIELYSRSGGEPTGLLAAGALVTMPGSAYGQSARP
jgi:hypothetical protein